MLIKSKLICLSLTIFFIETLTICVHAKSLPLNEGRTNNRKTIKLKSHRLNNNFRKLSQNEPVLHTLPTPMEHIQSSSQQVDNLEKPYLNNVEYNLRLSQLMEDLVLRSNIENKREITAPPYLESNDTHEPDTTTSTAKIDNKSQTPQHNSLTKDSLFDQVLLDNMSKTGNGNSTSPTDHQKVRQQLEFLQKNADKFKKFPQVQERTKNYTLYNQLNNLEEMEQILENFLNTNLNDTSFNSFNNQSYFLNSKANTQNNITNDKESLIRINSTQHSNISQHNADQNTSEMLQSVNDLNVTKHYNVTEQLSGPKYNYSAPISLAQFLKQINSKENHTIEVNSFNKTTSSSDKKLIQSKFNASNQLNTYENAENITPLNSNETIMLRTYPKTSILNTPTIANNGKSSMGLKTKIALHKLSNIETILKSNKSSETISNILEIQTESDLKKSSVSRKPIVIIRENTTTTDINLKRKLNAFDNNANNNSRFEKISNETQLSNWSSKYLKLKPNITLSVLDINTNISNIKSQDYHSTFENNQTLKNNSPNLHLSDIDMATNLLANTSAESIVAAVDMVTENLETDSNPTQIKEDGGYHQQNSHVFDQTLAPTKLKSFTNVPEYKKIPMNPNKAFINNLYSTKLEPTELKQPAISRVGIPNETDSITDTKEILKDFTTAANLLVTNNTNEDITTEVPYRDNSLILLKSKTMSAIPEETTGNYENYFTTESPQNYKTATTRMILNDVYINETENVKHLVKFSNSSNNIGSEENHQKLLTIGSYDFMDEVSTEGSTESAINVLTIANNETGDQNGISTTTESLNYIMTDINTEIPSITRTDEPSNNTETLLKNTLSKSETTIRLADNQATHNKTDNNLHQNILLPSQSLNNEFPIAIVEEIDLSNEDDYYEQQSTETTTSEQPLPLTSTSKNIMSVTAEITESPQETTELPTNDYPIVTTDQISFTAEFDYNGWAESATELIRNSDSILKLQDTMQQLPTASTTDLIANNVKPEYFIATPFESNTVKTEEQENHTGPHSDGMSMTKINDSVNFLTTGTDRSVDIAGDFVSGTQFLRNESEVYQYTTPPIEYFTISSKELFNKKNIEEEHTEFTDSQNIDKEYLITIDSNSQEIFNNLNASILEPHESETLTSEGYKQPTTIEYFTISPKEDLFKNEPLNKSLDEAQSIEIKNDKHSHSLEVNFAKPYLNVTKGNLSPQSVTNTLPSSTAIPEEHNRTDEYIDLNSQYSNNNLLRNKHKDEFSTVATTDVYTDKDVNFTPLHDSIEFPQMESIATTENPSAVILQSNVPTNPFEDSLAESRPEIKTADNTFSALNNIADDFGSIVDTNSIKKINRNSNETSLMSTDDSIAFSSEINKDFIKDKNWKMDYGEVQNTPNTSHNSSIIKSDVSRNSINPNINNFGTTTHLQIKMPPIDTNTSFAEDFGNDKILDFDYNENYHSEHNGDDLKIVNNASNIIKDNNILPTSLFQNMKNNYTETLNIRSTNNISNDNRLKILIPIDMKASTIIFDTSDSMEEDEYEEFTKSPELQNNLKDRNTLVKITESNIIGDNISASASSVNIFDISIKPNFETSKTITTDMPLTGDIVNNSLEANSQNDNTNPAFDSNVLLNNKNSLAHNKSTTVYSNDDNIEILNNLNKGSVHATENISNLISMASLIKERPINDSNLSGKDTHQNEFKNKEPSSILDLPEEMNLETIPPNIVNTNDSDVGVISSTTSKHSNVLITSNMTSNLTYVASQSQTASSDTKPSLNSNVNKITHIPKNNFSEIMLDNKTANVFEDEAKNELTHLKNIKDDATKLTEDSIEHPAEHLIGLNQSINVNSLNSTEASNTTFQDITESKLLQDANFTPPNEIIQTATEVVWLTQSISYNKPSIIIENVPYEASITRPLYTITKDLTNTAKVNILKPADKSDHLQKLITIIGNTLQESTQPKEHPQQKKHANETLTEYESTIKQSRQKIQEDVTLTVNCHTSTMSFSIPSSASASASTMAMTAEEGEAETDKEDDAKVNNKSALIEKTIENDKQNIEKWSTFKNNQLNDDSLTKSGNLGITENANANDDDAVTETDADADVDMDAYVNDTEDVDDGNDEGTTIYYDEKNMRLEMKVENKSIVNGNINKNSDNDRVVEIRNNDNGSAIQQEKYHSTNNEFKASQIEGEINEMSTIENKLLDISKNKSNVMTKTATTLYDKLEIVNNNYTEKDYQYKGNEMIIKNKNKNVINSNSMSGIKTPNKDDEIVAAEGRPKDKIANMFDNLLKTQSFPATTPSHSDSNANKPNKNILPSSQIKEEITTTNWWHSLPYAEIRKFLNSIFDSVTSTDDFSLNGSVDSMIAAAKTTKTSTTSDSKVKTIKKRKSKKNQWPMWILNNIWSSLL